MLVTVLVSAWMNASAQVAATDFSNRISLIDKTLLAGFEDDGFDGFVAEGNIGLKCVDGSIFNVRPSQGERVMLVCPPSDMPGNEWRSVVRVCEKPLDLSGSPVAQISVFSQEGPAIDQVLRLRLWKGSAYAEGTTTIIPGLWRSAIFDFTGCKVLDAVDRIEVSFMTGTDKAWSNGDFAIDGLFFGKPLDLSFMIPGSEASFSTVDGKIGWKNDALEYKFRHGAALVSPELGGSRNRMFSPPLGNSVKNFYAQRNTVFVVMENRSKASRVRLEWTTDKATGSKEFEIIPRSGMRAYYFNISDCPEATGNVQRISLAPVGCSRGKWLVDQIRFEREEPIIEYAGAVTACTADESFVRISGTLSSEAATAFPTLAICEYPLAREGADPSSLKVLHEQPSTVSFDITDIPNSRLGGKMTHLSSRFLAVLKNGKGECKLVDKPFYISNWRDFTVNPYHFDLPAKVFDVKKYGAKGDGFTDDTKAIQKAIDACSGSGGGQVVLPGDGSPQGRRYVVTHITMKSNVDLHIGEGALLWQSYDMRDYDYVPVYGHDFVIPACPWTHCMYINKPLIQGNDVDHIKVTGPGKIRMADPWSLNPDWSHYASPCSDRIHVCALILSDCSYIELTDFDEIRANNYHTNFATDDHMFIGNVKLYEVRCVSGDGFGFSQGSRHIRVERCFFDSNDDGIVVSSSYKDPRGKNSPWRMDVDEADHTVRDILVEHSYINSGKNGGGKAIALIPWGSTNPDQTKQLLDSVRVYDCVLKGGHSVGTWCDNPFDGKPFTNTEVDDYAPVQNFRILGNEYLSACDLLCVKPTNFITDCGLHSSSVVRNHDFSLGSSYWTVTGDAGAGDGNGFARSGGSLMQGLYVSPGSHVFSASVRGTGCLEVRTTVKGDLLAKVEFCFESEDWTPLEIEFGMESAGDVMAGLGPSQDAGISGCTLK